MSNFFDDYIKINPIKDSSGRTKDNENPVDEVIEEKEDEEDDE